MFGGKHAPAIQYSWDTVPDYYIMNGSGQLVQATNPMQTPDVAETFRNAQVNGIIKRGKTIYAAISKNKVDTEEGDLFNNGKPRKVQSRDLDQTYYVPYDLVSTLVEQEGYNLQGWDKFTQETQYGSNYSTGGGTQPAW